MDFTTSYDEESGLWLSAGNPLTSIEPSKMYMINVTSDCIIELKGKLLEDVEITLNTGRNWLVYPLNIPMDVNAVLANLDVNVGDQIESKEFFSTYYEGFGWYGTLVTLEPGQGYIYTNNSSETKTFKYPTELDIKLLEYETKEDAIAKLEEAKDYTDTKTDELRDVVTQTLSLTSGDSWCSFYVDITLEQLQQALGTNAASITTSFDGNTEITSYYNADTNTWSGNLTTLDVTKMYQIYINTDCEIHLTGKKIPNSTKYILNPGWNWISFPMNTEISVTESLANLQNANTGDVIKNSDAFIEYLEGWGWDGILSTLKPGQGYMYQNTSTEPKTLVFTTELIDTKSELNKKQDTLVSGTNIKTVNGESLLGEGNIVVSGGSNSSGGAYALVEHGTNDTTFMLTPNTFHVWGEITSLTLTFEEEESGVANEFLFQFESGETATTLTLPDNLIWANDDTPVIESNYTYQVSILKGLAAIMKFKKKTNLIENKLTVTNGGINSTFTFEYPVASDVSVTFTSDFGDTDIVTIYSGSMSGKTDSAPGYNSLTNNNIEYITPEKDSVYIYTF